MEDSAGVGSFSADTTELETMLLPWIMTLVVAAEVTEVVVTDVVTVVMAEDLALERLLMQRRSHAISSTMTKFGASMQCDN